MQMDPYTHIRLLEQERERTMAHNALVRAARSTTYDQTITPKSVTRRRRLILRLAAFAGAIANVGSLRKAPHSTRTTGA
jgi:hypothetical protein